MVTNATVAPNYEPPQEYHGSDPTTHRTDLCQMTKAELLELAEANGVEDAKPNMRKVDLIEVLEGAGL